MLSTLRAHALSHPLLLFAIAVAIFAVLSRYWDRSWNRHDASDGPTRRRLPASAHRAGGSRARVPATYLLVLLYLTMVIVYAATPAYYDHVEPSVASVSWVVVRGQTAYPGPESAGMYGLPYGPMLFLLNGLTMRVLGAGIITSKLAGAGAAMASLFLVGLAVRRVRGEWLRALRWTALVYLMFGAASMWVRAEPLLLLASGLAVLSLTVPPVASLLLIGVAIGLGVNLKVSAIIYLFPAFVLVWKRQGPGACAAAAAAAAVVAALPYIVFPNISLAGYLSWVQAAAGQGVRLGALPTALEWMIVLMVPMVGMWRSEIARGASDVAMFRVLVIAAMVVSTAVGRQARHRRLSFPAVRAVGHVRGMRRATTGPDDARTGDARDVHAHRGVAGATLGDATMTSLPSRQIVAELRQIEAAHAGAVAMGYSANYRLSFFRPELVFARPAVRARRRVDDGLALERPAVPGRGAGRTA